MAVTKAKKIEKAELLNAEFTGVETAILATFTKLRAGQAEDLRKSVRSAGAKYRVVKNSLAERASKGSKIEAGFKGLTGVTSLAYTKGDPVALAKVLAKFAKDNPELTFKAMVLDGKLLPVQEIQALATMPSKEEIYSKLLFLISAPAQRLVTVMNAVGKNVAVVVNQGVEHKKFKEEAEATS